MKLVKYAYILIDCPDMDNWLMDEINLQSLNLIVGKNATGKSRVLIIPTAFAGMITQSKPIYSGNWDFTFTTNDNREIIYKIKRTQKIEEQLFVDNKLMIDRDGEKTRLYSQIKMDFEVIAPPDNKLVLHVRRDKVDHPFIEDIVEWAEHTHAFKFGQIHPTSFLENYRYDDQLVTVEDIPELIEKLHDQSKVDVMNDFNSLGYSIEDFYAKVERRKNVLYVQEEGLKYELRQNRLSQGMFRSLALIVFIHYLIDQNSAKTVIVDDLGEGLDYDRATKLGELLFTKLQKSNIQFIASSNESFLMDVVNTQYWNILRRKDNTIKIYNYTNSKDKFENFKFSGLSNFDLFSSDYLD